MISVSVLVLIYINKCMMLDVIHCFKFFRKNRRNWLSDFMCTCQDAGSRVGGRYLWMFSSEVVRVLPLRVIQVMLVLNLSLPPALLLPYKYTGIQRF
jgi:hypothetical protein